MGDVAESIWTPRRGNGWQFASGCWRLQSIRRTSTDPSRPTHTRIPYPFSGSRKTLELCLGSLPNVIAQQSVLCLTCEIYGQQQSVTELQAPRSYALPVAHRMGGMFLLTQLRDCDISLVPKVAAGECQRVKVHFYLIVTHDESLRETTEKHRINVCC